MGMLAALTGMRRGDLCALRWFDIDFESGLLKENHSVVVAPKGLVEKSTKSNRGWTDYCGTSLVDRPTVAKFLPLHISETMTSVKHAAINPRHSVRGWVSVSSAPMRPRPLSSAG
jgi:hypothetical protein